MVTRTLLTVLAFAMGIYRATQGAYIASAGLLAMGAGLVVLRLAERQPRLRPIAYLCFAGTAAAIALILFQGRQ